MPERKSFLLRIDAELYEALRTWSDQEMRSVNGQIEYVLRQAIANRKGIRAGEHRGDEFVQPTNREGGAPSASDLE